MNYFILLVILYGFFSLRRSMIYVSKCVIASTFNLIFINRVLFETSRRFVAVIPNIRLSHRMFGINILILQRMFGKILTNIRFFLMIVPNTSIFLITNIRYFYHKSDDFLKNNGCSERATTLDVRNEKSRRNV